MNNVDNIKPVEFESEYENGDIFPPEELTGISHNDKSLHPDLISLSYNISPDVYMSNYKKSMSNNKTQINCTHGVENNKYSIYYY